MNNKLINYNKKHIRVLLYNIYLSQKRDIFLADFSSEPRFPELDPKIHIKIHLLVSTLGDKNSDKYS